MKEALRNKSRTFLKVHQEFVDRKIKFTWKSSLEKRSVSSSAFGVHARYSRLILGDFV